MPTTLNTVKPIMQEQRCRLLMPRAWFVKPILLTALAWVQADSRLRQLDHLAAVICPHFARSSRADFGVHL